MNYHKINEIPVKVHGRTIKDACPLPIFWSRSGIEVNIRGGELWVDIEVGCDFQEPWFVTEINGAFMSRQMLLKGRHKVCLFRNLNPGELKNVKFYKDNQMVAGEAALYTVIHGVETDGTFEPVEDKKLKIEFVGDSITSGEGTYGSFKEIDWRTMFHSSSRQYASYIERALDVESRVISHGGWGVYTGWDNDIRSNIPSIYEKVCGLAAGEENEKLGAQEPNDFSSWQPDAVIVNLCTNDNSAFDQPPFDVPGVGPCKLRRNEDRSFVEEDIEKIKNAITDFLKVLRKNNPKAHILWAYGMLGNEMNLPICDAINRYVKETKDNNVAFLNLPDTTAETVGSFGHPGMFSQEAAAEVLIDYLSKRFDMKINGYKGNI
jgi:hypothetical protein